MLGRAYEVVEAIDGGPAGDTLRAIDTRLDRPVRVTVMREAHAADPLRERVLERAKARSRVVHENVASLYYFGDWNGRPLIVGELVEGDNLPTFVAAHKGRLPLEVAFDVVEQILRGLAALHASGAPHGGLRPLGVHVTSALRAVLTEVPVELPFDLGAQRVLMLSTPHYTAPELVDAALRGALPEATVAADIFAVGVLVYSVFTGFLPTDEPFATTANYRLPIRPSELSQGFSPALDEPLLRALAADPAQRFTSAKQFREALRAAKEDRTARIFKPRFLLVDDDLDYREIVTACLLSAYADAIVVAVSTGREALERVERETFALVLLDLDLPDMNGIEITAAIRGSDRGRDVPIAVVTGRGGAAEWRVLASMGASAFIVKPIEPTTFVEQVRRVVEK